MARGKVGPEPKDTFLTKLDDDEGESERLFPISSRFPSFESSRDFCAKCTNSKGVKILLAASLIITLLSTAIYFHLRISALEKTLSAFQCQSQGPSSAFRNDEGKILGQRVVQTPYQEGRNQIRKKRRAEQGRHSQGKRSMHGSQRGGHGRRSSHAVEFMHPPSKNDEGGEEGHESLSNNSDSVVLTSYSRIPLMAIQEFCSKTKDYCPQGPRGLPGLPGVKGDIGETGIRGPKGPVGPTGPHGMRGQKGEAGRGVAGRDGLPGHAGLDGRPGRHGVDGTPGNEGMPGSRGNDGSNGIDGKEGPKGAQGEPGPQGLAGLMGPAGPKGRDGINGIPGVNTTVITGGGGGDLGLMNTTVFIPPSIIGFEARLRPLVVVEGEKVILGCRATGSPTPSIMWTRDDSRLIWLGSVSFSEVNEPLLNFTKVNRINMGRYVCYADNAITPRASRIYELQVNFGPGIEVKIHVVKVQVNRTATLECEVEAFPRGATSWQTSEGRYITSNSTKYKTSAREYDFYRVKMVLTVTSAGDDDFGDYSCVAKNTLGIAKGVVRLEGHNSSQPTPPPEFVTSTGSSKFYGNLKPEMEEETQLCPTRPPCPEQNCPPRIIEVTRTCTPSGYHLADKLAWSVNVLEGYVLPQLNNRSDRGVCQLSAVGKPVFHGEFKHYGSWMRETSIETPEDEKYYKTRMDKTDVLYEYDNKTAFTKDQGARHHGPITPHFQGNFHTIYNGSFFYVAANPNRTAPLKVIQYSLSQDKEVGSIVLPKSSGEASPLYAARFPESRSLVDLAVDENGLWAIYTLPRKNNTIVVKIEVGKENNSLSIIYGWNITISHTHAGDMWITCGILYAVDSVSEQETKIRLGVDLYRQGLLTIADIGFTNPFKQTSMVSYNPKTKQFLTLDDANLLVYPVKQSVLNVTIS